MTKYNCPNCRGGFPKPVDDGLQEYSRCPWCGQALDGGYDPPTVHSISKVESSDEPEPPHGVLGRLFGWGPNDE